MTSEEKRQRHKEGHRSRIDAAREAAQRSRRRQRLITSGIIAVVVVAIIVAAVVLLGDDGGKGTATDAPTTSQEDPSSTAATGSTVSLPEAPPGATIEGETPCPATDGSEERVVTFAQAPPMCIEAGEALEAEIVTSKGTIVVALDTEAAPVMANNFVVLARYHYFDGLPFHRLVPDFVAQTGSSGIPDWGNGGPGYDQEDIEKPTDAYAVGDVAMARAQAVSGSQFFLVATEAGASQLTQVGLDYPRFGRVTEGQELVAELASLGDAAANGAPTELVTMDSVTIRPAG